MSNICRFPGNRIMSAADDDAPVHGTISRTAYLADLRSVAALMRLDIPAADLEMLADRLSGDVHI